jgi:hypothetical protein
MKMGRHHVINLLPPYLLVHYLEKEEIQFVASAFSAGAIRRNVTSKFLLLSFDNFTPQLTHQENPTSTTATTWSPAIIIIFWQRVAGATNSNE